jgi:hypothetical protein
MLVRIAVPSEKNSILWVVNSYPVWSINSKVYSDGTHNPSIDEFRDDGVFDEYDIEVHAKSSGRNKVRRNFILIFFIVTF